VFQLVPEVAFDHEHAGSIGFPEPASLIEESPTVE
jgi:hypothetical protein